MITISEAAIRRAIAGRTAVKVKAVTAATSTQLLAKDYLAHHPSDGPVAFFANQQTAGYGQHGRGFYSPADQGLYFSLLLAPQSVRTLRRSGLLTTSVAVGLADILERYYPDRRLNVKWVNDLFLEEKKVAGILTEAVYQFNSSAVSLIIGIGVNLSTAAFPKGIGQPVGALDPSQEVDRNRLAADLLVKLSEITANYSDGRYLPEYRRRCFLLGHQVRVSTGQGVIAGTAIDISKTGALVVQEATGKRHAVHSGEVAKVDYQ